MSSEQPLPPGTQLADVDIGGVMRMLPHRYPFLFVDRVVELRAFQSAVGIKNVTINEPYFPGHFPAEPIMPGVIQIETMAQTAAVLAIACLGAAAEGSSVYFMAVENARFRRPVRPGDQLRVEVTVIRSKMGVWKFGGRVMVDGALAAEAEFSAKIMTR